MTAQRGQNGVAMVRGTDPDIFLRNFRACLRISRKNLKIILKKRLQF